MQIISGSSNQELAKQIASDNGYKLLCTKIENFANGELKVQILDKVGQDVAIIQSTNAPTNDHLIELLLLIDAAKCAGAKNIIAVVPYFGYSRQDKASYEDGPIALNLIFKMIEAAGATKIITLDFHSNLAVRGCNIPIENLSTESIFLPELQNMENIIVVSPDAGGVERARKYSSLLSCNFAVIEKIRDENNSPVAKKIVGDVKGKNCIIIDDIVDSGNSLCVAAELLLKQGAENIQAIVTHALLSGRAAQKIMDSAIKTIYISDSVRQNNLSVKFKIVASHKLLSSILK
jgi:ribose-phosphate pyrophosphokinase